MTKSRSSLVILDDTPWYHVVSRCVRRAFLCGEDGLSGKDFDYRRQWIVDRIKLLSSVFAIDIAAYAIMSNHYHIIIRIDRDRVARWDPKEILVRWSKISSVPFICGRYVAGVTDLADREIKRAEAWAETYRERLYSLSWFMKFLNEYIARRANEEDGIRGHFWEGRYKTQALLDERALLAAMVYVDLNPLRAGLAATPEEGKFTSIYERIQQVKLLDSTSGESEFTGNELDKSSKKDTGALMPFDAIGEGNWAIPFGFEEYLELVDWAGRAIREDKRGVIDGHLPVILDRFGIKGDVFIDYVARFLKEFGCAVGAPKDMVSLCVKRNKRFLKGIRAAKEVFNDAA